MAPRLTAALAAGAIGCALAMGGCGDGPPPVVAATPPQYVAAVEGLLDPPSQLAASVSERVTGATVTSPGRRRLERLVQSAQARLEGFRALRLDDPALRRQRDRIATAYARLLPRMRTTIDALVSGDRPAVVSASAPFLDALGRLPSVAAPSR